MSVRVIIELDDQGRLGVSSTAPLGDKILHLGLLDLAREAVLNPAPAPAVIPAAAGALRHLPGSNGGKSG